MSPATSPGTSPDTSPGTGQVLTLPWHDLEGYHCFGCCSTNAAGLALVLVADGDDGVASDFTLARRHESYPGIIHGGIGATVLDEVMGNTLALREHKICFTTGMRLRFLAPLRTNARYRAKARIAGRPDTDDGLFKIEGEIEGEHGATMLMASGSYRWMTAEQADAVMQPSPARSPKYAAYFRAES